MVLFNVYDLLVNQIFGNVMVSIFAVLIVLIIMLIIGRSSTNFIVYWMSFYLMVMGTIYFGALGLMFGFIIAFVFFGISAIRYFYRKE